jgi:hypothetical protein
METSINRVFFEELCRLRALYRLRSEYDATPFMPVDEAIAYASQLLAESEASAEHVPGEDLSAQTGR